MSPPRPLRTLFALAFFLVIGAGLLWAINSFWLTGWGVVDTTPAVWNGSDTTFDVIVVGSEPEGVAAAVAAAEEGAATLLVTKDNRIGGLFVTGAMNSLDLRTQPFNYQQGIFLDWWRRVGHGYSFDVEQAAYAFNAMLAEAGVVVKTGAEIIQPLYGRQESGVRSQGLGVRDQLSENGEQYPTSPHASRLTPHDSLSGIKVNGIEIEAQQIIDATADADFAAEAGAPFTVGFSSLGYDQRMADTLVFRIEGIDWQALKRGIEQRGTSYAKVNEHVAWGHFGGYPAAYEAVEEGVRLRGLNLGRQDDGSVLVNALLIYGIDPFNPASVANGIARATREAPRIVEYLKQELPGFENAHFAGVADTLYIRESRHLQALCTLNADDVLDNRVTEWAIAAGGYPMDVQTLTPHDDGYVFGTPDIYGVQLCVTIPPAPANLWVVGKAAGYDPIAASSARVVPFGMVVAEAVGVAAARAAEMNITPQMFVANKDNIKALRQRLKERGAYLPSVEQRQAVGPVEHPHYDSYRLMLSHGLALGGYDNHPKLDEKMAAISYIYLLSNVGQRFLDNEQLGQKLIENFQVGTLPLTADLAAVITAFTACKLNSCVEANWQAIKAHGLVSASFPTSGTLSRGEVYTLAAGIARLGNERRAVE